MSPSGDMFRNTYKFVQRKIGPNKYSTNRPMRKKTEMIKVPIAGKAGKAEGAGRT